jgi:type II secretion system (T2SS) protein M
MNLQTLLIRRTIALGLLLLVVAIAWFGVIAPIVHGFADRAAQREQLADDLARGRRLIDGRSRWQAQLAAQRAQAAQFAVFAPSASSAAQLSTDRISAAIQTPGGMLSSLREQPALPGEARLRVEARLTLTQLVASLRLLEGQKPFVIIEGLSIATDPAAAAGQPSPMEVRIDLAVPYLVTSG